MKQRIASVSGGERWEIKVILQVISVKNILDKPEHIKDYVEARLGKLVATGVFNGFRLLSEPEIIIKARNEND